MFRASDYEAAQTPWQVELGGRVFTARLVSQEQLLGYNARVERAALAPGRLTTDPELQQAIEARMLAGAFRWLLRQAFPWGPTMLVRGDPVRRFFALPPAAFRAAREDFFASLARAHATAPDPRPTIPGQPSSGN